MIRLPIRRSFPLKPWVKNTHSRWRLVRWVLLIAGLVAVQGWLFGPSLRGEKILLPLDLLLQPRTYFPVDPAQAQQPAENQLLSDLVFIAEPFRHFSVSEIRAGRIPLWNPLIYCGTPFVGSNGTAIFQPYRIMDYLWDSPVVLAWSQVVKAIVSGMGAYLFFRQSLRCQFVPSLLGAWCFPLIGGMGFWGLFTLGYVVSWTPWLLWSVDRIIRKPMGLGLVGVAVFTAAGMVSGHAQVAAHELLISGFFAVWRLGETWLQRDETGRRSARTLIKPMMVLALAWGLGFLLSMPQTLPTLDYLAESSRIGNRLAHGDDTRGPIGIHSAIQLVFPFFYGTPLSHRGPFLLEQNFLESAATGSAGLVLTLFLAPLAWLDSRRRSSAIFWTLLLIFTSAHIMGLPIITQILDQKPLVTLTPNRWVIFAGFSILTLGIIGLDAMWRGRASISLAAYAWIGVLAFLGGFCVYRSVHFPDALQSAIQSLIDRPGIRPIDPAFIIAHEGSAWYQHMYLGAAMLTAVGIALWIALWWLHAAKPVTSLGDRLGASRKRLRLLALAAGLLGIGELTFNLYGFNTQSDPALYFPQIESLVPLKTSTPGRICGVVCFEPDLNMMLGLSDIRGYDALDPRPIIELLRAAHDPKFGEGPAYELTASMVVPPGPVANMLNLRYYLGIARAAVPVPGVEPGSMIIIPNLQALPRVYVPRRVQTENDKEQRLARLVDPHFDPSQTVLVESAEPLTIDHVDGDATIIDENPQQVRVRVHMRTKGVMVLADRFVNGWHARTETGEERQLLRVNHALRGVVLPPGDQVIQFTYEPASFTLGVRLAGIAAIGTLGWSLGSVVGRRRWMRFENKKD